MDKVFLTKDEIQDLEDSLTSICMWLAAEGKRYLKEAKAVRETLDKFRKTVKKGGDKDEETNTCEISVIDNVDRIYRELSGQCQQERDS